MKNWDIVGLVVLELLSCSALMTLSGESVNIEDVGKTGRTYINTNSTQMVGKNHDESKSTAVNLTKTATIRKCCQPNASLDIIAKSIKCLENVENFEWKPILYSAPEKRLDETRSITFEIAGLPMCDWIILDNRIDKWFNILDDGNVTVGLNFWTIPLWLRPLEIPGYCVDVYGSTNTSGLITEEQYVLVFCQLENFKLYLAIRLAFGILFMISAASLLATMIIYLLLWNHQSIHGRTQFSFFLSLFLFKLFEGSRIFAKLNGLQIEPTTLCFVHALLAHYATIVCSGTSCMMCMDCFVTFWKLKSESSRTKREFAIYLFISWCLPLLALVVGLAVHFANSSDKVKIEASGIFEYAHYRCSSPIWEFVFRVQLLLLIANLLAFFGTGYFIIKHTRSTSMATSNRTSDKNWKKFMKAFKLFLKLFSITGITWMLSAIDLFWGYKNPMGWMFILVRASTSLQGIVYLIIFGLHQKNFVRLQRKYPRLRESHLFSWLAKGHGKVDLNSSGTDRRKPSSSAQYSSKTRQTET